LYFSLDGVPSATPAWTMTNILELLKPPKLRGTEPTVIPGASGALPHPLRADATERVVYGQVFGRLDPDGSPHSSEIAGLDLNLATLVAAWAAVPGTTSSLRTCVLHRPGHTTKTGPVQVVDFDWDYESMPVVANTIMRLLIPAGSLA
jgi:hypothetical protein